MSRFMEEMLRGEDVNGLQLLIGHSAIMLDRIGGVSRQRSAITRKLGSE
jgi:hypothetical protein